ncbi:MAG: DinB family protein [Acidobacteriota bacterium]|nr:DinB family protein [Acidobacteriota bacterium]
MSISDAFIGELEQESAATRKCLERIPENSFDWKPHDKSFPMLRLATHIAEMVGWIKDTVEKPEMDFAIADYKPFVPNTTSELVEFFDKNLSEATDALKNTSDEAMMQNWKLRNGEQIYLDMPRAQVLRSMVFNHIINHRGQLSVYLRLNDIPVPALYGPSADEGTM